ncbi:hypothetical protein B0J15DRAFT_538878 [Fusarium solani]|uniref:Uncharacterized protein n=1 Tax=Fusarium solani TaxID=169388 RepID=A0A9P9JVW7_FUSSL|nr:uncharacterized protein B0J15DRAFT_538878 [Fusarium solani]KAH7234450.1 hypothetical protein B0J15DRAFT_538878 [Fusarium solani]
MRWNLRTVTANHAFREGTYRPSIEEEQDRMDLVRHPYCVILLNCTVEVDGLESEWSYLKQFGFIHPRELEGCVSDDDELFHQLQATYSQFLSDGDTTKKAENAQCWLKILIDELARFGKPLDNAVQWKTKLEAARFRNVYQEMRRLKEIGRFQGIQQVKAVESYMPAEFDQVLVLSNKQIQTLVSKLRKELSDPSIHLYIPVYFVWWEKPGSGDDA